MPAAVVAAIGAVAAATAHQSSSIKASGWATSPKKPELVDQILELTNTMARLRMAPDPHQWIPQWEIRRNTYQVSTDVIGEVCAPAGRYMVESVVIAIDADVETWRAAIQTLLSNKDTGAFR